MCLVLSDGLSEVLLRAVEEDDLLVKAASACLGPGAAARLAPRLASVSVSGAPRDLIGPNLIPVGILVALDAVDELRGEAKPVRGVAASTTAWAADRSRRAAPIPVRCASHHRTADPAGTRRTKP